MSDNVQVAELHEKLVAFAQKTGRSKSKAIARAIAAYLGCPEEMEIDDRIAGVVSESTGGISGHEWKKG